MNLKWPLLLTISGLSFSYYWAGLTGLGIALILSVLEISLSFDNAILNTTVLKKMDRVWQHRFLTWGLFIAVFGLRFLFPILIVAIVAGLGIFEVVEMAFLEPQLYAKHLLASHVSISAFGGMFLLLVFFSFLFDQSRHLHWLGIIEQKLNTIGKLESMEVTIALVVLISFTHFVPKTNQLEALSAGIIGIIVFMALHSLSKLLSKSQRLSPTHIKQSGMMRFIYLEVLDASFSLDGVVGAFAITKDIVIIIIGLTIGALFVRTLTLMLVYKRSLDKYLFVEHGAHYAIGALAIIMLLNMSIPIPELLTGLIGVCFIGLSFLSSVKHNRKQK